MLTVTGKIYADPSQAALCVGGAKDTGCSSNGETWVTLTKVRGVALRVVGDVEWVGRLACEALNAIPSHVLNHQKGSVGDEDL